MNRFLFIFILILQTSKTKTCRNYYKQNVHLRGILFTHNIIHEYNNVMVLQECVNFCKINHCLSFSVYTDSGLCRLYSHIFDNLTTAVSQEGASYFYQWSDTCLGWKKTCSPQSTGVYVIRRISSQQTPYSVLCDMDIDGGGWTVLQNRFDGSLSFDKTGKMYESTFGNFSGEFWLGLSVVKFLCYDQSCEARIELEDWQGLRKFASYTNFRVGWWGQRFKLTIDGYSGTAGDAMGDLDGMKFSTFDMDEDMSNTTNCAELGQSGWWYNDCGQSNLNGNYAMDNGTEVGNVMSWQTFHGINRPLKKSRMMLRVKY
ncbi:ficolin-1-like [Pecten maximus]|uniref:ficolin-1-like n=1 Tax=Pecten maximus TaxID=6579 RepID=UPI0014589B44|nr:ficolin-1-like [Pecten maximus]